VKLFTAHTRAGTAPVLVREGFSWGALLFGPFWLFAHRAWIAGALALCAWIAASLTPDPFPAVLLPALAWLLGVSGSDLVRWSLERRGFLLAHVIAGANADAAFARLLAARPDLLAELAP
jgi:hypothetical protein